ncbi:hypothetical protein CY35_15G048900 [Sphagnum magellanicum]|nr:hypothetical protein CY35_15G048900 [Sphagnum magellanicum]
MEAGRMETKRAHARASARARESERERRAVFLRGRWRPRERNRGKEKSFEMAPYKYLGSLGCLGVEWTCGDLEA